jgi:plastocyanin
LTAALILALGSADARAQWGTLKGKFVYDGSPPAPAKIDVTKDVEVCGKHPLVDESLVVDPAGGLANAVIWVRTKGVEAAPSYANTASATVVYDNKGCRFDPHILAIRTSQTLEVHNSDPLSHNSNMAPLGGEAINPLLPANGAVTYNFAKAPIVPTPVTCNIHPWMKGYIVAKDNPYVAVSKPDGTFEIKDLPVGELEFQAWHEKSGYLATPDWGKRGIFKYTIKDGDNDLGTIKLNPELFNK